MRASASASSTRARSSGGVAGALERRGRPLEHGDGLVGGRERDRARGGAHGQVDGARQIAARLERVMRQLHER